MRTLGLSALVGLAACAAPSVPKPVPNAPPRALPSRPQAASSDVPSTSTSKPARVPPEPRVARLALLARVWGEASFGHPYLWEGRELDWDAAASSAILAVRAAATDDEAIDAIDRMLHAIGDPITRVDADSTDGAEPAVATSAFTWSGSVLVVKPSPRDWHEVQRDVRDMEREIPRARSVVFDLRAPTSRGGWRAAMAIEQVARRIVRRECSAPGKRRVVHSGYRPQRGATSGGYFTGFVETAPTHYTPDGGKTPERVVFLANEHSVLPEVAFAMQRAQGARIVAQGGLADPTIYGRKAIPLGHGRTAYVRTEEIDGEVRANAVLPASALDASAPLEHAIALAVRDEPRRATPAAPRPLPSALWKPDATYADERHPPVEHRLLGLFRLWNVIRLFYPYFDLLEPNAWDDALADFIPVMEQAGSASEYALAVARLAARIPDSHVRVASPEVSELLGRPLYQVTIQRIEAEPVVTAAGADARSAGLRVGDVIVAVDGEPFERRAARVRPYIAASNAWTLARDADTFATGGPRDSEAVLRVRGADERERDVRLRRAPWTEPPSTEPYRRVGDGSIGYIDMTKLAVGDVDAAFSALASTRAVVFDMRGGPRGTMWAVTPYLNAGGVTAGPRYSRPLLGLESGSETHGRYAFVDLLPTDEGHRYPGRTVALINEFTQSEAESAALFFEAANGTRLVGSPSAGADGDITNTCLPGDVCVSFSGHEVRHADGRPLQRVGLKPDVEARPTLAGLRAGRDEVLERALRYLDETR
jgi:C-terminal processing protease CtpA/Prc